MYTAGCHILPHTKSKQPILVSTNVMIKILADIPFRDGSIAAKFNFVLAGGTFINHHINNRLTANTGSIGII